ncbi:ferritin family protein [Caldisericum exile]|uniref:Rubrerythrin family protein n=1 Tax=Caldisericum exile (strain DSM 21853 / NBRC 104410 / AZM16c01) TaxID=511051 RepID=A0A7U6GEQ7_CALEA|nr:ferritin family protein [Caldisericum exile]BAL81011.1 rubrerythrin family protein [Caldisericum exile AZM16c01]
MSDVLEVLKAAMEVELNGINLYKVAAEKTDDKQAREVFLFLASEEGKHYKYLKDLHDAIKDKKEIEVNIPKPSISFRRIFSEDFLNNLKGKNFEFSAISTGMILEKNSILFYKEQAEKANDAKVRYLFLTLSLTLHF